MDRSLCVELSGRVLRTQLLTSTRHQTKTRNCEGSQFKCRRRLSLLQFASQKEPRYTTAVVQLKKPRNCAHRRDGSRNVHVESSVATLRSSLWPPRRYSVRHSASQRVCGTGRFWLMASSDFACSFVARRSVLDLSWASAALRLSSAVLWHAFFRSTNVAS